VGLESVRIVLVEPAGERNLGSVARVMKNMGLRQLVVVNPQCDVRSEDARRMAVRAAEILDEAVVVQDLASALDGCHRIAATVGREETQAESLRSVVPWLLPPTSDSSIFNSSILNSQFQTAIIFGREDHGLGRFELKYAQRLITIPSNPDYPSLNLAQAVGICCDELHQHLLQDEPTPAAPIAAPFQLINAFYLGLEELLLTIGYLHDHTAESRMRRFRLLLDRAVPSTHEMTMLMGILRQMRWAIQQKADPYKNAEQKASESVKGRSTVIEFESDTN
jgi:tRNA/rRNA methyltransferase